MRFCYSLFSLDIFFFAFKYILFLWNKCNFFHCDFLSFFEGYRVSKILKIFFSENLLTNAILLEYDIAKTILSKGYSLVVPK